MELSEMIKVMEHFKNRGKVKFKRKDINITTWSDAEFPNWNWNDYDYRIKEQKQKVIIEKWLCKDDKETFLIIETSSVNPYKGYEKIKLIESYEVEL